MHNLLSVEVLEKDSISGQPVKILSSIHEFHPSNSYLGVQRVFHSP